MQKIGNFICSPKTKIDEDIFHKFKTCEEIDNNLPTLIIGLDNAKKCISNFSILNKVYKNGNFRWTLKKNERRIDYEEDLHNFTDYCYNNIIKDIKYVYIDLINYSLSRIKNFIKYLNNKNVKYCYQSFNEGFIFLFDKKYNTVYGLSLTLCEYLGIRKEKVLTKLFSNKNIIQILKLNFFNDNIKKIININPHYIPSFYEYFVGN